MSFWRILWHRDDRAGLVPCVGKGRKLSVGFFCSSNQSAHILGICAPGRICSQPCMSGPEGQSAYVRPAVSPASPRRGRGHCWSGGSVRLCLCPSCSSLPPLSTPSPSQWALLSVPPFLSWGAGSNIRLLLPPHAGLCTTSNTQALGLEQKPRV